MSGLSVAHRVALAALIEQASDATLTKLSSAAVALPGARALELADMLPGTGLTSAIRRTCQASAAGSSSTALSPPSSLSESEIRPP